MRPRTLCLAAVLSMVSVSRAAEACTIEVVPHRAEFRVARAVFIGTVISVTPLEGSGYVVRLRVDKHWKGPKTAELAVLSDQGQTCGGPRFEVSHQYLVYAQGVPEGGDALQISPASRSRATSQSGDEQDREIQELNSWWFRFKAHISI